MKILAIETSCDETAIAIIEADGSPDQGVSIRVLANVLLSQVEKHKEFGGVYPTLAKREHIKNLVPLLQKALLDSQIERREYADISVYFDHVEKVLEREQGLAGELLSLLETVGKPEIDLIAVTAGPGLEPALWVGINFAKALGIAWDLPVMPINHMEGHVFSSLMQTESEGGYRIAPLSFPALALLISGGHTEFIAMDAFLSYRLVGETRDDAVGEAFDKVARMMHLPYPGGPEVSKRAEAARAKGVSPRVSLPRPMLTSGNCDFSFAGLKTAVLYSLAKYPAINDEVREEFSLEFENAVTEVIVKKTMRAIEETGAQTLIVGGGVSANKNIRAKLAKMRDTHYPTLTLFIPAPALTTDNALMIAAAAYIRAAFGHKPTKEFVASGTLAIEK